MRPTSGEMDRAHAGACPTACAALTGRANVGPGAFERGADVLARAGAERGHIGGHEAGGVAYQVPSVGTVPGSPVPAQYPAPTRWDHLDSYSQIGWDAD